MTTACRATAASGAFAALVNAPIGFAVFDARLRVVCANAAVVALASGDPVGRPIDEVLPALSGDLAPLLADVVAGAPAVYREVAAQPVPGGVARHWLASGYPAPAADGVPGAAVVLTEITERKRLERLLTGQKEVLEQIVGGAPLPSVLDTLVRLVQAQSTSELLGSVLLLDDDGAHLRHAAGPALPAAYNEAVDGLAIGDGAGSCGTAAYRARTVVAVDIASDPLWADYRELALAHGLRACWSTPIVGGDGRVLGTFAMYHRRPHRPTTEDLALIAVFAHSAALAIERDRTDRARERVARELQEGLLPPRLPEIPGVRLAACHRAAGEGLQVGGDFYDAFALGDGGWAFVIGDVCGTGPRAAATAALVRHTVRAVARHVDGPEQVVRAVNDAMLADERDEAFVTLLYGELRPEAGSVEIRLVCAGHPAPLVARRGGSVERVRAAGQLLGQFAEVDASTVTVSLAPAESLVCVTDGVLEARAPGGEWYDDARLADVIAACDERDARCLAAAVERSVLAFAGGRVDDDLAVVVVTAA